VDGDDAVTLRNEHAPDRRSNSACSHRYSPFGVLPNTPTSLRSCGGSGQSGPDPLGRWGGCCDAGSTLHAASRDARRRSAARGRARHRSRRPRRRRHSDGRQRRQRRHARRDAVRHGCPRRSAPAAVRQPPRAEAVASGHRVRRRPPSCRRCGRCASGRCTRGRCAGAAAGRRTGRGPEPGGHAAVATDVRAAARPSPSSAADRSRHDSASGSAARAAADPTRADADPADRWARRSRWRHPDPGAVDPDAVAVGSAPRTRQRARPRERAGQRSGQRARS
jgi:hypothetical protein